MLDEVDVGKKTKVDAKNEEEDREPHLERG
jgi:hypothetical protein